MAQDSTSAEYIVHLFSGLVRLDASWKWSVTSPRLGGQPRRATPFACARTRVCRQQVISPTSCTRWTGLRPALPRLARGGVVPERYRRRSGIRRAGDIRLRAPSAEVVEIAIDEPTLRPNRPIRRRSSWTATDRGRGDRWMVRPTAAAHSSEQVSSAVLDAARYYGLPPALDRVEYVITGGFPITMYENDELDIVEVPPSEMERMSDPENPLHDELEMASELSVLYLGVNVNLPPYDDPDVRRALARAIDKAKIADLVLQGSATPADGILPPSMPDYDPSLAGLPYDPDAARALLAGSNYGAEGLPPLVLVTSGTSGYPDAVTEAVLSFFEDNLGVEATIHQV